MSPDSDGPLQQRYRELVANIEGIVWEADARTLQFTFVSQQAERLLGYPLRAWLEPGFWERSIHPDDRRSAVDFCRQASRENRNHQLEHRMVAADGRVHWVRDIVSVVVEQGETTRLHGITVDITDRKRAEEERQVHLWFFESLNLVNRAIQGSGDVEQMMRDALDAVITAFQCDRAWLLYPCDPDASVIHVPMERTRPGYPGAFAQGINLPVSPEIAEALRLVLGTEDVVSFGPGAEHPLPPDVAAAFGVQSQLVMVVHLKADDPYAFGLHQCSRARIWTPEERRLFQEIGHRMADAMTSLLTLRSLREREARLAAAERIAHVGYWEQDLVADMVSLSDELLLVFGLSEDERTLTLAQWHARCETLIHPEDVGRAMQAAAALADGMRYDLEYRVSRPDGTMRFVRSQAIVTRDDSGRPIRVFGTVQDITELKQLEQQLRQAQKMEAVGQLAGGVAHDFNNLLTVINGCSELVFSQLPPDDPSRELLAEVLKAGERAATLTRQLLAFGRKQVLQPKIVDLNVLLADILTLLERLIGANVRVTLVRDAALGLTKVDPGQFDQLIINLAVNARDAMPQGGQLTIETRNIELGDEYVRLHPYVSPGPYVQVVVRDSGHGMDEATRARIFEPFFTTKRPGEGTGLGLPMVYGLVKQSGGHIEVESEVGQGTTFTVFLPIVSDTVPRLERTEEAIRIPTGTETVLLVEDEHAVRALTALVLQSNGYTVLEARDGEDGVRVALGHAGPIHLLLTDIVMPRMSGTQLAAHLAAVRPGMKVLYMSGYPDEASVRHGVPETAAFLQKPFNAIDLARRVRAVLDVGSLPSASPHESTDHDS